MADPDYFTLAELRALPDCADFSEAQILAAAAFFTEIVEGELGVACIARTRTETFDGMYTLTLPLAWSHVVSLTSVEVDGTAVDTDLLTVDAAGRLRYKDGFTRWSGASLANVAVVYTAGLASTCPADIKDAVMWATRDRLLSQSETAGSWDRKTSVTNEFGTIQYALPGEKRPTGYPELDALIASRQRALGPAAG